MVVVEGKVVAAVKAVDRMWVCEVDVVGSTTVPQVAFVVPKRSEGILALLADDILHVGHAQPFRLGLGVRFRRSRLRLVLVVILPLPLALSLLLASHRQSRGGSRRLRSRIGRRCLARAPQVTLAIALGRLELA